MSVSNEQPDERGEESSGEQEEAETEEGGGTEGGGVEPPGWASASEIKMTLMVPLSWTSDTDSKLVNSFPNSASMN